MGMGRWFGVYLTRGGYGIVFHVRGVHVWCASHGMMLLLPHVQKRGTHGGEDITTLYISSTKNLA